MSVSPEHNNDGLDPFVDELVVRARAHLFHAVCEVDAASIDDPVNLAMRMLGVARSVADLVVLTSGFEFDPPTTQSVKLAGSEEPQPLYALEWYEGGSLFTGGRMFVAEAAVNFGSVLRNQAVVGDRYTDRQTVAIPSDAEIDYYLSTGVWRDGLNKAYVANDYVHDIRDADILNEPLGYFRILQPTVQEFHRITNPLGPNTG